VSVVKRSIFSLEEIRAPRRDSVASDAFYSFCSHHNEDQVLWTKSPFRKYREDIMSVLDSIDSARAQLGRVVRGQEVDTPTVANRVKEVKSIINKYPQLCRERDKYCALPLHYAAFYEAPLQVVELLVACYPEARVAQDDEGDTPLHKVFKKELDTTDPEVDKLLISPEAARIRNCFGELPLHCYFGSDPSNLQVLQMLVQAFPDSIRALDNHNNTPLHHVSERMWNDDMQILRFILESYPGAAKIANSQGELPLHLAFEYDGGHDLESIQLLVDAHPQAAAVLSHNGSTPTYLAFKTLSFDLLPVIQLMTNACPECLKVLDSEGRSQLHLLLTESSPNEEDVHLPVFQWVINQWPEALQVKDSSGEMPLHVACREMSGRDDISILQLVIASYPEALMVRNSLGESPLLIAFLAMGGDKIKRFIEMLEFGDSMSGSSLLHILCEHCSEQDKLLECLQIMDVSKTVVQAKDSLGRTPLHVLSSNGAGREACQVLLDVFPDLVKVSDNNGNVPLHTAIHESAETSPSMSSRYYETVQCLLGAFPRGVHVTNTNGMTPLELACEEDADLSLIYELVCVDPMQSLGLQSRKQMRSPRKRTDSNQDGSCEVQGNAKRICE